MYTLALVWGGDALVSYSLFNEPSEAAKYKAEMERQGYRVETNEIEPE